MCIFIFVCTSVALLPPGGSPIAISDDDDDDDGNNKFKLSDGRHICEYQGIIAHMRYVMFMIYVRTKCNVTALVIC